MHSYLNSTVALYCNADLELSIGIQRVVDVEASIHMFNLATSSESTTEIPQTLNQIVLMHSKYL